MIGTISHGTLRTEDLLDTFASELERRDTNRDHTKLIAEAREGTDIGDCETTHDILEELFDALDSLSPPYCWFGASEGDGSDFGFWPCLDSLENAREDGDVLKVDDLSEIPSDWRDGVMLVNDHGNVAYLEWSDDAGEHVTVWDCV